MYFILLSLLASLVTATPLVKAPGSKAIANKWIVKLKDNVATMAADGVKAAISTKPDYQYSMPGFRGFAGTLSDDEVALLQASDQVRHLQHKSESPFVDLCRLSISSKMLKFTRRQLSNSRMPRGEYPVSRIQSQVKRRISMIPVQERERVRMFLSAARRSLCITDEM